MFLLYAGTYMVVFALVSCILLQIAFLNSGLARFESLYNVPIFTSTWIVGTVLGGGIMYGEFSTFSLTQALVFPLGIGLCCVGVFFLARGGPEEHQQVAPADEGGSVRGMGDPENGSGAAPDSADSSDLGQPIKPSGGGGGGAIGGVGSGPSGGGGGLSGTSMPRRNSSGPAGGVDGGGGLRGGAAGGGRIAPRGSNEADDDDEAAEFRASLSTAHRGPSPSNNNGSSGKVELA